MNQGRFLVIVVILCPGSWWFRCESRVSDAHVTASLQYSLRVRQEETSKAEMASYDLTKTIIPYLDRHLVFPLLTHLHETGLFAPEQVAAAQYELAKGTNMVDYIVSLYEQLNADSEVPQGVKLLRLLLLYVLSYANA
jgi:eIF3 subunit 6 N terminal domain